MIGSSVVSDAERQGIEALIGVSLDSPVTADVESKLRVLCGVLLSTPQFQLGGVVAPDAVVVPALTPGDASSAASCERLNVAWLASGTPYELRCLR